MGMREHVTLWTTDYACRGRSRIVTTGARPRLETTETIPMVCIRSRTLRAVFGVTPISARMDRLSLQGLLRWIPAANHKRFATMMELRPQVFAARNQSIGMGPLMNRSPFPCRGRSYRGLRLHGLADSASNFRCWKLATSFEDAANESRSITYSLYINRRYVYKTINKNFFIRGTGGTLRAFLKSSTGSLKVLYGLYESPLRALWNLLDHPFRTPIDTLHPTLFGPYLHPDTDRASR